MSVFAHRPLHIIGTMRICLRSRAQTEGSSRKDSSSTIPVKRISRILCFLRIHKNLPTLCHIKPKMFNRSFCLWHKVSSADVILAHRGLKPKNRQTIRSGFVKLDEVNLCPRSVHVITAVYLLVWGGSSGVARWKTTDNEVALEHLTCLWR